MKTDREFELRELIKMPIESDEFFEKATNVLSNQLITNKNGDIYDVFWPLQFGEVTEEKPDERIFYIWSRNDGGKPLVIVNAPSKLLAKLKFGLFLKLQTALSEKNQLSFIKVGHPVDFMRYEIYGDGEHYDLIVEADAFLNTITKYKRDENGYVSRDGEFVQFVIECNHVAIKKERDSGAFF